MPELPEVETVVRSLRPKLIGRAVRAVQLNRRDIVTPPDCDLTTNLTERRFVSIDRRGKRIVFKLDNGERFYIHLGMSGRLKVEAPSQPVAAHTHLTIGLDDPNLELRFTDPRRFGGVWWMGATDACDNGMGPEPLALRASQLAERLARTRRAIKSALLDQRLLAGLGNIYVDESLFAAGIHPLNRADKLSPEDVNRLNRAIKLTLRRAVKHKGSTLRDYVDADGRSGGFQYLHRVYDRAGAPCRTCQTSIRRIVLGGRSTCFCPACQSRRRRLK